MDYDSSGFIFMFCQSTMSEVYLRLLDIILDENFI